MNIPIQPAKTDGNKQSGAEVAQKDPQPAELATPQAPARVVQAKPRSDVGDRRYWRGRLFTRTYTYQGKAHELPELNVRIQYAGQRHTFNLGTDNKDAAAAKALEIWKHLEKHDWPATLQRYARRGEASDKAPTVGDFLAEVQRTANLKPRTFHRYAQYLRQIVAHVVGIMDAAGARYDYRTGGRDAWLAKVDTVPLDKLTPQAAADWRTDYLARAGDDPLNQTRNRRAFNAALRSAKSLFADRIITADNFRVIVPRFKIGNAQKGVQEALWFEKLQFEKAGSMKFEAPQGITPETLVLAARRELREGQPDAYLLLLLCLCAGLRRTEADVLLWRQIHSGDTAADCFIEIEANQYHQPKHDSAGRVYVEPALVAEVLGFKARSQTEFVVSSPLAWKRATTYHRYRCAPHWDALNAWLGSKGITDRKRIHTLRKLFGDTLTKTAGIYAAAGQLRHSTVAMTERHYSDPRQQAPLKVAHLLTDQPIKDAREAIADDIIARLKELSPAGLKKVQAALKKTAAAQKSRRTRGKIIPLARAAA